MAYCDVSDLYKYGLQPGSLPNTGRLIDSVTGNVLFLDNHGFQTGDEVTFRADAADGELPAPLAENVTYYALRLTDSSFSVSTAPSGPAVTLTTEGQYILAIGTIPYAAAIAFGAAVINDMLPAHIVPIDENAIPEIVRITNAQLAIAQLAVMRLGATPETLSASLADAQKRLDRWARGVPIRGTNSPKRAMLSSSATQPYRDVKGWRTDETI